MYVTSMFMEIEDSLIIFLFFKYFHTQNKQWYYCRGWQMKVYFEQPVIFFSFFRSPFIYVILF